MISYSLDGRRLMLISIKAAVAVPAREILVVIFEMALANFEHHARSYSVFYLSQRVEDYHCESEPYMSACRNRQFFHISWNKKGYGGLRPRYGSRDNHLDKVARQ